jgi:hypothetical protein
MESEILANRLAKARKRYSDAIEQAIIVLKCEKEKLSKEDFFEAGSVSGLSDLLKLNGELNGLLFLKDQIENQKR